MSRKVTQTFAVTTLRLSFSKNRDGCEGELTGKPRIEALSGHVDATSAEEAIMFTRLEAAIQAGAIVSNEDGIEVDRAKVSSELANFVITAEPVG